MAAVSGDRAVVTLRGDTATRLRDLSQQLNANHPEVIRQALASLDLRVSLTPTQRLLIRDDATGETTLVRFV
jgi:hypothetical protein